jgi:membrane associated rhomboid family serine protease
LVFRSPAFYSAVGKAFVVMCMVVPALAVVVLLDQAWHGHIVEWLGIRSGDRWAIFRFYTAPFLHFGWDHLRLNSSPIVILGTLVLAGGTSRFFTATAIVATTSGFAVWFFTPPGTLVVGASGVIFGWVGLLILRGLLEHTWWHLVVALVVGFLYGWELTNNLVSSDPAIAWQGHVGGFVGGLFAAVVLRVKPAKPEPKK